MHPAPSIILFTVLSGLGLGLIIWMGLGLGPDSATFAWVSSIAALGISGIGGMLSALHLGKPSNASRSFSQWRSSWLSREACLLVTTLAVFDLYAAIWCLAGTRLFPLGLIAAALAGATIYSTAMIYAQIRAVPRWSLTPTPYLLTNQSLIAVTGGTAQVWLALLALVCAAGCAVWWQSKASHVRRSSTGASIGSATGLGKIGKVRLFESPHTGSNYLLDEMAYQIARHRADQLRKIGFGAGFAMPILLACLAMSAGASWLLLALVSHVIGMIALRWLFFAEAQHVQAMFYGQDRVLHL
ncbi:dimethyl sulfoxide reductase anchor subunit family protein [Sedimentitalea todarodis]|uniref:Dimethyl sulfoxide reductase anchor subunit n=1 Tax=Sedimentitalea todarodis TaxID=1631240 RepID=A0ABU3VDU9_9RHOB|nr:DmsC/YnfH family molybdoenzyme membrane anchor subunit [Sedimentitalea todarodis]MDU9004336.1 dimethyl sulfoxide reductase anchor subunit [Sedimentitalea todarodis]